MYNNSDIVSHLFWVYWKIEEEQQKKEEQKHKYKQSKQEIDEKAEEESWPDIKLNNCSLETTKA